MSSKKEFQHSFESQAHAQKFPFLYKTKAKNEHDVIEQHSFESQAHAQKFPFLYKTKAKNEHDVTPLAK